MVRRAGTVRSGWRAAVLAALALAGCASKQVCTPTGKLTSVAPPPDWRDVVTDPDHDKLRKLRQSFLDGLAQARAHGFAAQVDAEGRLLNPDYAQDGPTLKDGTYRCRKISLGSFDKNRSAFLVEPARPCTVATDGLTQRFVEEEGTQRVSGRLYVDDDPARGVFLGTRILPDEPVALHYGRDADRDMVGALQRVGDARWRIAMPAPAWGASVQVIEVTPAG